jgi:phosphatidylglycerophosphatase A
MSIQFIDRIINLAIVKTEKSEKHVKRSPLDYVALSIATCGIGYMPIVPATFGSLVGVGFYLLAQKMSESFVVWTANYQFTNAFLESSRASFTIIFLIALFLIGTWAATRVVKLTGKKDPRIVIIDEVIGQLITFLFIPAKLGWWTIVIGFLAFRFFDILKPYPANKLESLPTGLGVMADDVMAGFYAAALMSLLCLLYLTVF